MEAEIREHARMMTRHFCSRLLDAAQQDANPDKKFQEYLAIFARTVSQEIVNLDKSLEICGDLDVFAARKGYLAAVDDANKRVSEAMKRRNEIWRCE